MKRDETSNNRSRNTRRRRRPSSTNENSNRNNTVVSLEGRIALRESFCRTHAALLHNLPTTQELLNEKTPNRAQRLHHASNRFNPNIIASTRSNLEFRTSINSVLTEDQTLEEEFNNALQLDTAYNNVIHEYNTDGDEIENDFTYVFRDIECENEFSDMLAEEAVPTGDGGISVLEETNGPNENEEGHSSTEINFSFETIPPNTISTDYNFYAPHSQHLAPILSCLRESILRRHGLQPLNVINIVVALI